MNYGLFNTPQMTSAASSAFAPSGAGQSPWAVPGGSQQGTDFLAGRAAQTPWFTMNGSTPEWRMPGGSQQPQQGSSGYAMAGNPYMGGQADDITRRTQDWLGSALQGIKGNSVGVGNLGGTRQGVAEAGALSKGADMLSGNLAQLYSGNWNQDQNRALTDRGQQMGFYTAQRGQDLQQTGLGASLWGLGQQGAWGPLQAANGVYGNYTGFGQNTGTSSQGGGWQGAIAGGLAGAGYAGRNGWW